MLKTSPPIPLNQANLLRLSASIPSPVYDRERLVQRIVHIGVGGFHRAHQAVYLDDLLSSHIEIDWGICGVCLLPQDEKMYRAMKLQDCLYTVVEQSASGSRARIVGSITDILFAPENPQAVIEKMASPECQIVSLTITEGGYYVDEGSGGFDAQHPDILHDLANPEDPKCSFGYLAAALESRRRRGLAPFTLMSCDNMQSNGDVFKGTFLAFATLYKPALAAWLAEKGAFPNSMVDRITPVTTDQHRDLLKADLGIEDRWPVATEPFRQWVIEDHFCSGRPPWEKAGAQITWDVLPYEKMKIRLLNASHQALCYIGMLVGHRTVDQAIGDPRIRRLVAKMMEEEAAPTLPEIPGIDLGAYQREVIERFANPAIGDQLARIGTDGSARIPKFVLPIIADQLANGGPVRMCAFTVAAWFRFLRGADDNEERLPIDDHLSARLCPLAEAAGPDPASLLSATEIFGNSLANSPDFAGEVGRALRSFHENGAESTLEHYAS